MTSREPLAARYHVEVGGRWRGHELAGTATLVLEPTAVALEDDGGRRLPVALESLVGVRAARGEFTLYLPDGEIALRGEPRLAAAARDIVARAVDAGELTLELRALGSHRHGAGALQHRWFEPLLSARKKLERAADARAQTQALDGRALGEAYESLARSFAREHSGGSPADRRALEAHLEDCAAPLAHALADVAESARTLLATPDERTIAAWRGWRGSVRLAFAAADRCWPSVARTIESWRPGPAPGFWSRLTGGSR
jgi:hypothetical protein